METFAAQAVIAIENVRQFRALEARTEEVRAQAAELESLNAGLHERVESQVGEIERMAKLKRFLSPAVADALVSSGDDTVLASHRALIATLFCDIRGFTRHSPDGLPSIRLPCPKALCQAIRLFARCEPGLAGSEERAKRLLRPTNALTSSRAGTPIRPPGSHVTVWKGAPIMRKLLQPEVRAGR